MMQFLPSVPNEALLLQIKIHLLAENTARTQIEQLYSARQQFKMGKKQMQTTIHNLNEQLKVMKLETEKLKLNQKGSEITSQEEINDDGDLAEQNRDIKVMIKNFHHSYQPVIMLCSLNDQGLQALNATSKLKWKTKNH
jgi:hypothetical protein